MDNLDQLPVADVLAFGAHPDDIEIATAGLLLLLRAAARSFVLVDATRGEMGSRGTAAVRAAEASAAATRLGAAARINLGLPDTKVQADEAATNLLVAAIRRVRPHLLLAPHAHDLHPDHSNTSALASRAFFLAGLRNHEPQLGQPHRPRLLLRYPGNHPVEPNLVIDITAVAAEKSEVLRCYASQLAPPNRSHLLFGLDVLERADVRDRFHGSRIGARVGEGYCHEGPLPVRDLGFLLV